MDFIGHLNVIKELIIIVGGGYFGVKALLHLSQKRYKILIIDVNEKCKASKYVSKIISFNEILSNVAGITLGKGPILAVGDGAYILAYMFYNNVLPAFIIPTAPFHVAARIAEEYLKLKGIKVTYSHKPLNTLCNLLQQWHIHVFENYGIMTISRIPPVGKCPIPCNAKYTCPILKRNIATYLFNELEDKMKFLRECGLLSEFIVVKSILLNSVIGAYSSVPLYLFLRKLKTPSKIAIATCSRCHGVVNFFELL